MQGLAAGLAPACVCSLTQTIAVRGVCMVSCWTWCDMSMGMYQAAARRAKCCPARVSLVRPHFAGHFLDIDAFAVHSVPCQSV